MSDDLRRGAGIVEATPRFASVPAESLSAVATDALRSIEADTEEAIGRMRELLMRAWLRSLGGRHEPLPRCLRRQERCTLCRGASTPRFETLAEVNVQMSGGGVEATRRLVEKMRPRGRSAIPGRAVEDGRQRNRQGLDPWGTFHRGDRPSSDCLPAAPEIIVQYRTLHHSPEAGRETDVAFT